jgi:dTMP kinase
MSANWGHQASKYATDAERIAAIDTLAKFELNWLKLPPAHRVIYLNLPPEWALKAMKADSTREALDMHELAGLDYKNKVRDSFLWCCKQFPGWAEVKCLDDKESRYSREELSNQIFDMLKTEFVAPAPKSQ